MRHCGLRRLWRATRQDRTLVSCQDDIRPAHHSLPQPSRRSVVPGILWPSGADYASANTAAPPPLRVVAFEEHVRAGPAMHFLVERDSPELPTELLQRWFGTRCTAVTVRMGRSASRSPLTSASRWRTIYRTVADERRRPLPRFHESLLDKDCWAPAAAAALSVRTIVEVWLDNHGYRQELDGTVPTGTWEECLARRPYETETTFHPDSSYFGPGEAVAWALRPEELQGEGCLAHPSPASFPLRDLRSGVDGSAGE